MTTPGDPTFGAYAGTRALVLGATGFIGRRVAMALAGHGAHVIAAGRDERALSALRSIALEWALSDLADEDDVARLVHDVRPDVTFNLAGYGVDRAERDDGTAHRINTELPGLLVRLLPAPRPSWRGQVLVHAGSALEYGDARGDLHEDTIVEPTTLYGLTKLAGTIAVAEQSRRAGRPAVTARLFTVYGPGEHAGRLLPALLDTARTGTPLPLTEGRQRRDFTFVDDAAEGMLRLGVARTEPGAVVNLATGGLESVRGFAERAARVLGIDPGLLRFGAVPTRAEEMSHEPVAIERLRAVTRWAPDTTIETGVLLTARALAETVTSAAPRPAE